MKDKDKQTASQKTKESKGETLKLNGNEQGGSQSPLVRPQMTTIDEYVFRDEDEPAKSAANAEAEKKEKQKSVHREQEKKRKDKIRAGIQSIGNLLPKEYLTGKESLHQILEKAVDYITDLKEVKEKFLMKDGNGVQVDEILKLRQQVTKLEHEKRDLETALEKREEVKLWQGKSNPYQMTTEKALLLADKMNEGLVEARKTNKANRKKKKGKDDEEETPGVTVLNNSMDMVPLGVKVPNQGMQPPQLLVPMQHGGMQGAAPMLVPAPGMHIPGFPPNFIPVQQPATTSHGMRVSVGDGNFMMSPSMIGPLSDPLGKTPKAMDTSANEHDQKTDPLAQSMTDILGADMGDEKTKSEETGPKTETVTNAINGPFSTTSVQGGGLVQMGPTQTFPMVPGTQPPMQGPMNNLLMQQPPTANQNPRMPSVQNTPMQGTLVFQNGQFFLIKDQQMTANSQLNVSSCPTTSLSENVATVSQPSDSETKVSSASHDNMAPTSESMNSPSKVLSGDGNKSDTKTSEATNTQGATDMVSTQATPNMTPVSQGLMAPGTQNLLVPGTQGMISNAGPTRPHMGPNGMMMGPRGPNLTMVLGPNGQPLLGANGQPMMINASANQIPSMMNQSKPGNMLSGAPQNQTSSLPQALVLPNGQIIPVVTQPNLLYPPNGSNMSQNGLLMPQGNPRLPVTGASTTISASHSASNLQPINALQTQSNGSTLAQGLGMPGLLMTTSSGTAVSTSQGAPRLAMPHMLGSAQGVRPHASTNVTSVTMNLNMGTGLPGVRPALPTVSQMVENRDSIKLGNMQQGANGTHSPIGQPQVQRSGNLPQSVSGSLTPVTSTAGQSVVTTLPTTVSAVLAPDGSILLLPAGAQPPVTNPVSTNTAQGSNKKGGQRTIMPRPMNLDKNKQPKGFWSQGDETEGSDSDQKSKQKSDSDMSNKVDTTEGLSINISTDPISATSSSKVSSGSTQDILAKAAESIFADSNLSPPLNSFYSPTSKSVPTGVNEGTEKTKKKSKSRSRSKSKPKNKSATENLETQPMENFDSMVIDLNSDEGKNSLVNQLTDDDNDPSTHDFSDLLRFPDQEKSEENSKEKSENDAKNEENIQEIGKSDDIDDLQGNINTSSGPLHGATVRNKPSSPEKDGSHGLHTQTPELLQASMLPDNRAKTDTLEAVAETIDLEQLKATALPADDSVHSESVKSSKKSKKSKKKKREHSEKDTFITPSGDLDNTAYAKSDTVTDIINEVALGVGKSGKHKNKKMKKDSEETIETVQGDLSNVFSIPEVTSSGNFDQHFTESIESEMMNSESHDLIKEVKEDTKKGKSKKKSKKSSQKHEVVLPETLTFDESDLSKVLDQVESLADSLTPTEGKRSKGKKNKSGDMAYGEPVAKKKREDREEITEDEEKETTLEQHNEMLIADILAEAAKDIPPPTPMGPTVHDDDKMEEEDEEKENELNRDKENVIPSYAPVTSTYEKADHRDQAEIPDYVPKGSTFESYSNQVNSPIEVQSAKKKEKQSHDASVGYAPQVSSYEPLTNHTFGGKESNSEPKSKVWYDLDSDDEDSVLIQRNARDIYPKGSPDRNDNLSRAHTPPMPNLGSPSKSIFDPANSMITTGCVTVTSPLTSSITTTVANSNSVTTTTDSIHHNLELLSTMATSAGNRDMRKDTSSSVFEGRKSPEKDLSYLDIPPSTPARHANLISLARGVAPPKLSGASPSVKSLASQRTSFQTSSANTQHQSAALVNEVKTNEQTTNVRTVTEDKTPDINPPQVKATEKQQNTGEERKENENFQGSVSTSGNMPIPPKPTLYASTRNESQNVNENVPPNVNVSGMYPRSKNSRAGQSKKSSPGSQRPQGSNSNSAILGRASPPRLISETIRPPFSAASYSAESLFSSSQNVNSASHMYQNSRMGIQHGERMPTKPIGNANYFTQPQHKDQTYTPNKNLFSPSQKSDQMSRDGSQSSETCNYQPPGFGGGGSHRTSGGSNNEFMSPFSMPSSTTGSSSFSFSLSGTTDTMSTGSGDPGMYNGAASRHPFPFYPMQPPTSQENNQVKTSQAQPSQGPPPLNLPSFSIDSAGHENIPPRSRENRRPPEHHLPHQSEAQRSQHAKSHAGSQMRQNQERLASPHDQPTHSGPGYPGFSMGGGEPPSSANPGQRPFGTDTVPASHMQPEKDIRSSRNQPTQAKPSSQSRSRNASSRSHLQHPPHSAELPPFLQPPSFASNPLASPPLHHHGPRLTDQPTMPPHRNLDPPYTAPPQQFSNFPGATFEPPPPLGFSRDGATSSQSANPYSASQKSSSQTRAEESRPKSIPNTKQQSQVQQQPPAHTQQPQKSSQSRSKQHSKKSKQYEMESQFPPNPLFEARSMTPYFHVGNLSPPPRNDVPTYLPGNLFNPNRPLSNSNALQHKNAAEMGHPFTNSLFSSSRTQNGMGLNFQPGLGVNHVHGGHNSSGQMTPHTSTVSMTPHMPPHMPNFNLSNFFHDNPGAQGDSLNISPIKFPHGGNPILPGQPGMDHNSLQHHHQPAIYHNRAHPGAQVLSNAMGINSLLGHQHHGFDTRQMGPGMNSTMGPHFGGHGQPFGMPLNFPMHDH